MKLALINDIHFGVKNDVKYMLDYQEKFFKNIFFPYLINNKIDTILFGGDLFDRRKYINFVTLQRTKDMFFNLLREYNIKMYAIPGNHCVYHKNTNVVNSIDQLLYGYDNIEFISEPKTLEFDGVAIDMIPWINNENYEDTLKFVQATKSKILYGHLELAGFEMFAGVPNAHGMDSSLFAKFEQVWSGHFHHKSNKGNINYLGAPMEFTFADCADPRGFHVFDTTTKDLTFIQNPYTLYDKVYYNDESKESQDFFRNADVSQYEGKIVKLYVVRKTKPAIFEFYAEKLFKANLIQLTIMEDFSEFREENIDFEIQEQSTKDLMDMYVDSVETDMDKPKLKNILNNLYIEALHSGV